jgi:hypothetical protein
MQTNWLHVDGIADLSYSDSAINEQVGECNGPYSSENKKAESGHV